MCWFLGSNSLWANNIRMSAPSKRHICFYQPKAYPVLANTTDPGFGGAEVKQVFVANALVSVGYEVTFLTNDFGQPEKSQIGGISIINLMLDNSTNRRGSFYRMIYKLWKAMAAVNADIFVQRAAGAATGLIAAFCKITGRHFIYIVASSYDVDGGYLGQSSMRNRLLYRFGLAQSSLIIVQAKSFRKTLFDNHGLNSIFIRDGHEIPKSIEPFEYRRMILFIGGTRPVKRPELFIELARRCPDLSFVIIGGPLVDKAYHKRIKNMAARVENLDFKGHVPRPEIGTYLSRAYVLVNTSEREGLPNTVTEAWSYGTPVVSLSINPDELLSGYLGYYCENDFEQLLKRTRQLVIDNQLWNEMSRSCGEYAVEHHNIDNVRASFVAAIENLSFSKHNRVGNKRSAELNR